MQIGKYQLSNTHGSACQVANLTLRLDGQIVAQVCPKAFDPLKYVRKHSRGKLARAFREQLEGANVCPDVIGAIFGQGVQL